MAQNKTNYSILIVCEGEKTETNYLHRIKEIVIAEKTWTDGVAIEIRPKPPLDEEEQEETEVNPHKRKRKRRKLKPSTSSVLLIEDKENRTVPTRYVWEAQEGLKDGVFDEVWAVFDKDYHPKHEKAFALAEEEINKKKVNIAFSSIAFEHWVLLHFERNVTAFVKSECKEIFANGKKKPISCGTRQHSLDCYGSKCCIGYLRANSYIPHYSKNEDIYPLLKDKNNTAFKNASWLRTKIIDKPIYEQNPYTTMDLLVKRLLCINTQFVWLEQDKNTRVNDIEICSHQATRNLINFEIRNIQDRSLIFNTIIYCCNEGKLIREIPVSIGLIQALASDVFNLELPENYSDLPEKEIWFEYGEYQINMELG